jgi:hypothetical protein
MLTAYINRDKIRLSKYLINIMPVGRKGNIMASSVAFEYLETLRGIYGDFFLSNTRILFINPLAHIPDKEFVERFVKNSFFREYDFRASQAKGRECVRELVYRLDQALTEKINDYLKITIKGSLVGNIDELMRSIEDYSQILSILKRHFTQYEKSEQADIVSIGGINYDYDSSSTDAWIFLPEDVIEFRLNNIHSFSEELNRSFEYTSVWDSHHFKQFLRYCEGGEIDKPGMWVFSEKSFNSFMEYIKKCAGKNRTELFFDGTKQIQEIQYAYYTHPETNDNFNWALIKLCFKYDPQAKTYFLVARTYREKYLDREKGIDVPGKEGGVFLEGFFDLVGNDFFEGLTPSVSKPTHIEYFI